MQDALRAAIKIAAWAWTKRLAFVFHGLAAIYGN
jgi:hypothetical protein